MSPSSILRLPARQCIRTQRLPMFKSSMASIRPFSQSEIRAYPRKDSQDKDSIDTEATEYSKSGTDDGAAKEDTAFDPSVTRPGEEENKAENSGSSGNPLDVSPANPDVSKQRGPEEGGAQKGVGQKQSGGGSPNKAGKP